MYQLSCTNYRLSYLVTIELYINANYFASGSRNRIIHECKPLKAVFFIVYLLLFILWIIRISYWMLSIDCLMQGILGMGEGGGNGWRRLPIISSTVETGGTFSASTQSVMANCRWIRSPPAVGHDAGLLSYLIDSNLLWRWIGGRGGWKTGPKSGEGNTGISVGLGFIYISVGTVSI